MSILILKPNQGHIAYTGAAETFRDLYQKVIGKEIPITETDDGISDLIVIGEIYHRSTTDRKGIKLAIIQRQKKR